MKLSEEEKTAIVLHRLQKAKDTLVEAKGTIALGYWNTAANRLYYACYYVASALLMKHGYSAHTHAGIIGLLSLHFVSKGIICKELGKFYSQLFELRQTGDYSDWMVMEEADVQSFVEPADKFIDALEKLITESSPYVDHEV
ncbi:MAG: HEPN domain-containing protein [Candidatus Symbiothrix sp.]|jgi:uncharacterized protein (UPF0332 family)|nr:HEPN domain-containing protein [Candidatus Symbiothrix sp.]